MNYQLTDNINWINNNEGYIHKKWFKGPCFKRLYAIKKYINDSIILTIQSPLKLQNNEIVLSNPSLITCNPLYIAVPSFTKDQINQIKEIISDMLLDIINKFLEGKSLSDTSLTNDTFLALLSKNRNWREECAICLNNCDMGQVCKCGHSRIVIFRPCGHSMCIDPCFYSYLESLGYNLNNKTEEGYTIIIDISIYNGFKCPLCRTIITKTFQAEYIKLSVDFDNYINNYIKQYKEKFDEFK